MKQLKLHATTRPEARRERVECPVCRGVPRYCSLNVCPYFRGLLSREALERKLSSESVFGPSPPTVFVGSYGYPKVRVGPMLSLLDEEHAALAEDTQRWLELGLDKILDIRLSMLYGRRYSPVTSARRPERHVMILQELAMSSKPVDTEVWLEKRPLVRAGFQVRAAPFGPTAPAKRVQIAENPQVPRIVDKVAADTDLKAEESVNKLYAAGLREYDIVRLLSAGLLGTRIERRFVPTEWSITAVDDIIGKSLRREVKRNALISDFLFYTASGVHNRVSIALLPLPWMFEVAEFWHRNGVSGPFMDSELPLERDRYPENVGGAYHAVRLPILEHLHKLGRQAAAVAVIEIWPGWIPLGVWRFRELTRRALAGEPRRFDDLKELLSHMRESIGRHLDSWLRRSRVLRFYEEQRSLGLWMR